MPSLMAAHPFVFLSRSTPGEQALVEDRDRPSVVNAMRAGAVVPSPRGGAGGGAGFGEASQTGWTFRRACHASSSFNVI